MSKLSIVCSYRYRFPDLFQDFVSHFRFYYPVSEIIIVEQCNSNKFLRGQLLNIGFQHSAGDIVWFTDIDLRLISPINVEKVMSEFQHPFYPYDRIEQYTFLSQGKYQKTNKGPNWCNSPGGMYVYTREQFEAVNGHSNLFFGHSFEDTDLKERANPRRLKNTIMHLIHSSGENGSDIHKNASTYGTRSSRDYKLDGAKQTVPIGIKFESIMSGVKKIKVRDISVCDNFAYIDVYKRAANG